MVEKVKQPEKVIQDLTQKVFSLEKELKEMNKNIIPSGSDCDVNKCIEKETKQLQKRPNNEG